MNKYVGESEARVLKMFEDAKESKPSVILLDEIDSLFGYSADSNDDVRKGLTKLFQTQMDCISSSSYGGIIVIGTTNTPWNLSDAILDRFCLKLHVPHPVEAARSNIFKLKLSSVTNSISEEQYRLLGVSSEGYNGRNIDHICKRARALPVKRIVTSTKFKVVDGYYVPSKGCDQCAHEDSDGPCPHCAAISTTYNTIPVDRRPRPPVEFEDVMEALRKVQPSPVVGTDSFSKWTEKYGCRF